MFCTGFEKIAVTINMRKGADGVYHMPQPAANRAKEALGRAGRAVKRFAKHNHLGVAALGLGTGYIGGRLHADHIDKEKEAQ